MYAKTSNWCGRSAAVVAFALSVSAANAQTTWHVNAANACPGSGSEADPFCAIQSAVNAAVNGDEVVVAPGTYNEAIDLGNKQIVLRSSGGADVTTIDASGLGASVIVSNGGGFNVTIEGFTITGGSTVQGGGLRNFLSSPVVADCIFIGNSAAVGGAISNDTGSDTTIINCQFINNTASNNGGAIHNINFSAPTVSASTFSGNSASSGGAIWNSQGTFCNTHVSDSTFCNNGANPIFGTWHNQGGNVIDAVGDINCDGAVDVSDLLLLLGAWGDCPGEDCPADLNDDGVVDVSDLLLLLGNWG